MNVARFMDIGVLEEGYIYELASPTLTNAKKNGTIRVITDFRELNLLLKHQMSPFSIPKIGHIICSKESFIFSSVSD
jgi:hypothetical protein